MAFERTKRLYSNKKKSNMETGTKTMGKTIFINNNDCVKVTI
jgi:hypothetical protein